MEDASWQALEPSQRRHRTLDALKRLLPAGGQVQPLLLVFENLHWIDAEATQAFLEGVGETSAPGCRLLLLVNYRPDARLGPARPARSAPARPACPRRAPRPCCRALLGGRRGLESETAFD